MTSLSYEQPITITDNLVLLFGPKALILNI